VLFGQSLLAMLADVNFAEPHTSDYLAWNCPKLSDRVVRAWAVTQNSYCSGLTHNLAWVAFQLAGVAL